MLKPICFHLLCMACNDDIHPTGCIQEDRWCSLNILSQNACTQCLSVQAFLLQKVDNMDSVLQASRDLLPGKAHYAHTV